MVVEKSLDAVGAERLVDPTGAGDVPFVKSEDIGHETLAALAVVTPQVIVRSLVKG
jgi:hypothetical protein